MIKINNNFFKNDLKYFVLIFIAFSLVWYEYGIKTALLGLVLLSSMFYLLLNSVKTYKRIKQKKCKEAVWNLGGIIFFSAIIYFLPNRLTQFAATFCAILFAFYIVYDIIKTDRFKANRSD
jgi:hypothetical protein